MARLSSFLLVALAGTFSLGLASATPCASCDRFTTLMAHLAEDAHPGAAPAGGYGLAATGDQGAAATKRAADLSLCATLGEPDFDAACTGAVETFGLRGSAVMAVQRPSLLCAGLEACSGQQQQGEVEQSAVVPEEEFLQVAGYTNNADDDDDDEDDDEDEDREENNNDGDNDDEDEDNDDGDDDNDDDDDEDQSGKEAYLEDGQGDSKRLYGRRRSKKTAAKVTASKKRGKVTRRKKTTTRVVRTTHRRVRRTRRVHRKKSKSRRSTKKRKPRRKPCNARCRRRKRAAAKRRAAKARKLAKERARKMKEARKLGMLMTAMSAINSPILTVGANAGFDSALESMGGDHDGKINGATPISPQAAMDQISGGGRGIMASAMVPIMMAENPDDPAALQMGMGF